MAIQYFASSVLIRTCANFCTGSLGTHPKPRDHTSCELRVFAKRCRHPYAFFQKCSSRSFMKTTFSFLQSSLFLLFCFIFSLWKTKQPLPPHLLNLWPKKRECTSLFSLVPALNSQIVPSAALSLNLILHRVDEIVLPDFSGSVPHCNEDHSEYASDCNNNALERYEE